VPISPQFDPAAEDAMLRAHTNSLLVIQVNLLRHCFRLQRAERRLYARARLKRPAGGRYAALLIERERQRLGRDLHTGLGQTLSAIRLQLEIIASKLPDPPDPVVQAVSRISTLMDEALSQVRSLSRRLHPPEWQRLALYEALQQLWDLSGVPQKLEASLTLQPLPAEPELEVKVLMYRVAQEALSNLVRHAQATRVDMAVEHRGATLVLMVRDNGVGFDAVQFLAAPPGANTGIGLRSIREQAAMLGGRLLVESGPDGTKLEVTVPYPAARP